MHLSNHLIISSILLGLTGCTTAPVPIAKNFPVTTQKVARSAQHWDVVANNIVEQTVKAINDNPTLQNRALYVPRLHGSVAFDVSFRNFLITHLVNNQLPVSVCKADNRDVEVSYEAQVIRHKGISNYRPGQWLALGTGVAAFVNGNINRHTDVWTAGIGIGALADVIENTYPSSTNTELIVTTTISDNNLFMFRRSDVYYVPDADASLFLKRVAQRSTCSDDVGLSNSHSYSSDAARQELLLRNIARSNPEYTD